MNYKSTKFIISGLVLLCLSCNKDNLPLSINDGMVSLPKMAAALTSTENCVKAPNDIIAWWPGDGNGKDIVGAADANAIGQASFASGYVQESFVMNGNGSYFEVPISSALAPASMTIEAWVNPSDLSGTRPIISKYDFRQANNSCSWALLVTPVGAPGRIRFVIYQSDFVWKGIDSDISPLAVGVWKHIAAVFDMASQVMKLFVDGIEVPCHYISGSSAISTVSQNSTPIRIGTFINGLSELEGPWVGQIDEISIYKRALGVDEIQAIYQAGAAGKCKVNYRLPFVGHADIYQGPGCGNHKGSDAEAFDYSFPVGREIIAAESGEIVFCGLSNSGYAKLIQIRHLNGEISFYAHLNGFAVNSQTGASVTKGQLIGYSGNTGNSKGPHLHFVIRKACQQPAYASGPYTGGTSIDIRNLPVTNWLHCIPGKHKLEGTADGPQP